LATWLVPYGTGMGPFNKTLAPFFAVEADRYFSISMTDYLTDGQMAFDITEERLKLMSCAKGPKYNENRTCERRIFVPGFMPTELLLNGSIPRADIGMALGMQGYVMNFGLGDVQNQWQFDDEKDCRSYGSEVGAARLCLKNIATNHIQARKLLCHSIISIQFDMIRALQMSFRIGL